MSIASNTASLIVPCFREYVNAALVRVTPWFNSANFMNSFLLFNLSNKLDAIFSTNKLGCKVNLLFRFIQQILCLKIHLHK